MKKGTKVGFVSLGCPKNLLDTEVMLGHLKVAGYEITPRPEEAQVLVVNTCGFIEAAKQESIDAILEMARHKKGGNCRRLVVAGCLAQRYAGEIATELPEVDAVIGLDHLDGIVEACRDGERRIASLAADGSAAYLYDHLAPRITTTPAHYAFVKISEGCDYPCTFCIIPKIRGAYRSRTPESILAEAEALASQGVRELVLVAQDTTRYGVELGLRHGLAELVRQLARVTGIEWVRFLYAYPTTVDDEVLRAMVEVPGVCRYLDMPLQHASNRVLKRMKRPGSRRSNEALIERVRKAVPGLALRSSFIVGFPGETEDDFAELMSFCSEMELDHVGVFTYSNEEDTEAWVEKEAIRSAEKERRRNRLMAQQREISARKNRWWVGRRTKVLVDGPSEESDLLLSGRTERQAPGVDGCVLINDGVALAGSFVEVQITEAHSYDLIGRIVTEAAPISASA
ncbi:MAG TPA: 30S ribosomal protein S12 methylthiotransferase RimO [Vicinamibacteria bacterium]|nr:30S ribosomal protein S12 methylthiotransferase RimO [Vicinamibacteria bacterium]